MPKLASQGINIFFTYWKAEPVWIEEFKQEITSMGVLCESLEIDLSNAHAAYKILDTVESKLGFPSILVNNAAHSKSDGYLGLDA